MNVYILYFIVIELVCGGKLSTIYRSLFVFPSFSLLCFVLMPVLLPHCSIVTFFVYYTIGYETICTCTFKYTVQCMYLNLTHDSLWVQSLESLVGQPWPCMTLYFYHDNLSVYSLNSLVDIRSTVTIYDTNVAL